MANNQVRIIAGNWRGRKIDFHDAEGLRPTSDRVRETLFNWIAPWVQSSRCLDLFAGSGALGLEALSRGAASVCFVDNNKLALQNIQKFLQTTSATKGTTYLQSAQEFIQNKNLNEFDIIFIDPPYAKFELLELIPLLEANFEQKNGSPQNDCHIFYEHSIAINESELLPNWQVVKNKKAGKVFYYLLKRQPNL